MVEATHAAAQDASVRTNKTKILLCLICPQLYFNLYAAMERPMKNSAVSYLHQ